MTVKKRWSLAVGGALLFVAIPEVAQAADQLSGLVVRPERTAGYKATSFSENARSAKTPAAVPLREAWESGAFAWTPARRTRFANDTAVRAPLAGLTKSTDTQRADRDPAGWLPSADARCAYVAKWIAVKLAWGLSVDAAEAARLRTVVTECAGSSRPSTTNVNATSPATSPSTTQGAPASSNTIANSALKLLESIRVGPEYTTGYDRELFPHWKDLDGDGCDARQNVLIRDSIVKAAVASGCKVISGKWVSPYDGATWTDPSDIDIDHVVALNEAWQSGAYAWTTQQRTNYANDLTDARTLMAVTDSVNQAKSDKDPSEWLPPLATYRCTYLANWVAVKLRWSLRMDQTEYNAVKAGLSACGAGVTVQTGPLVSTVTNAPAASATVTTNTAPTVSPTTASTLGAVTYVTPGAFCTPYGAVGQSSSGVIYTCKPSDTEARNRWRR